MPEKRERRKEPPEILRSYLAGDGPNEDGEWAIHCPFHDDVDPSAYINPSKGVWVCHRGCGHGPIKDMIERLRAGKDVEPAQPGNTIEFGDNVSDLDIERAKRRGDGSAPTPIAGAEIIESWHKKLLDTTFRDDLIDFQARRGLSLDTIKRFKIGYNPGRKCYTIPVFDEVGDPVNVRYYYPKATGKMPKYRNHKGYGRMALYPLWPQSALKRKAFVICEGELDAILLWQHGIKAITVTAGAGNWNPAWNGLFKEKKVWIVYDRDKAGVEGSIKVANHLRRHASAIHIVELPFTYQVNHGEDVTDFFVKHGMPADELTRILQDAEPVKKEEKQQSEKPIPVSVIESFRADLVDRPLEMRGTVVGNSVRPHTIPAKVRYQCTQDAGDKCHKCPMMTHGGSMESNLEPTNVFLLEFLDVTNDQKDNLVRELANIVKCNRMEYDVQVNHSVETLIVRSSIDHSAEEASDHTQRRVIAVGPHDTKISETIRFIGTTAPSPKDQSNEFQAWEVERDRATFDAFEMTSELGKSLEVFWPRAGQTPLKRLVEISEDLTSNVTSIVGRPALHIAIDLVYHSIIRFNFAGSPIDRGWLDVLVIGDTRTGKSETAAKLRAFYGLGDMVSCEAVSFAGVLGGLTQKFGNAWSIVWGVLPINDRRAVILDEVAGLSRDEIGQLSSVRSSGIAKIQKIESQETFARTRLLWLANPRDGKSLAEHTYGVRAIAPLIGNPEDIARFDFALAVSSDEVPFAEINTRPKADGFKIAPELYRSLVFWAWSRKAEDVIIADDTLAAILEESNQLPKEFIEKPPLVQGANIRMKLARIATAIASRLFSTDETYEKVLVRPEHVLAASRFLTRLYSNHNFGYQAESRHDKEAMLAADKQRASTKIFIHSTHGLLKFLMNTPTNYFGRQQVEEFLNCSREHANGVIKSLSDRDMVKPGEQGQVVMQPILLDILREMK